MDTTTDQSPRRLALPLIHLLGYACLSWLLVALAALDAEHFWLPDRLTLPGAGLGLIFTVLVAWAQSSPHHPFSILPELWPRCVEAILAASVVLLIRWAYWLIRRKEGMGLGDAKLMAMIGAWLGLLGAMESFALGVLGAAMAAVVWLAILAIRGNAGEWAKIPLPFGTFICLSALSEIFFPDWPWTAWSSIFLR
jgi:leader peptidase (prepilin peptidase)/N-methyltransferase